MHAYKNLSTNEKPKKKRQTPLFLASEKKERVCLFFFAVPRVFSSGDVARDVTSARRRTQKEKGLGTFFQVPPFLVRGWGESHGPARPRTKNQSPPSETKGLGEKHSHSHLSLSLAFPVLFSQLGKHAWKAVVLG